jgi:hypothetical protein
LSCIARFGEKRKMIGTKHKAMERATPGRTAFLWVEKRNILPKNADLHIELHL